MRKLKVFLFTLFCFTSISFAFTPKAGQFNKNSSDNNIYYNDGNVGIGTSSPSTELDVNGTATTAYGVNASTGVFTSSVTVTSGLIIGSDTIADGVDLYVVGNSTFNGDVHITGKFTNGRSYLHAYFVHTDTGTTALAADTWEIAVGTWTINIGNNFTVSGATITYTGTYTIPISLNYEMSIDCGGVDSAYWKSTKNGVRCVCSRQERKMPANDTGTRGLICSCMISTGDKIALYCKTKGGADLSHIAVALEIHQMN